MPSDCRKESLGMDASTSCALLALPVEVLQRILVYVPDRNKHDGAWHSALVKTSMLLPISHTCRRLRDITISYPALWESVSVAAEPVPYPALVNSVLGGLTENAINRSGSRPLCVELLVDKTYSRADPGGRIIKSLWPSVNARAREIHVAIDTDHTVTIPWDPVFEHQYPRLESFSLCDMTDRSRVPFLPSAQGLISQLRYLDLRSCSVVSNCVLPKLTHLALWRVTGTFAGIFGMLDGCPNLESLIMHNFKLSPLPSPLPRDPPGHADPHLPRLRRVVLRNMRHSLLPMFLSKLLKHPHSYSLQIIGIERLSWFHSATILLRELSLAPPQTIRIGLEPLRDTQVWYTLSVMFMSSRSLVRVGTLVRPPSFTADGLGWLGHTLQNKSFLATVTELWLLDLPWNESGDGWRDSFDESLRSVLAALPMLEVVSIAHNHSFHTAVPDLRLLPDGRESVFSAWHLKTVRFVHGYDRDLEYRVVLEAGEYEELLKPRETKELSLARILDQLRTGAFDYLSRLVLRVPSHFTLDEAELAQLRGCVSQVDIEYSDERPEMPLPEYAREPEASGCSSYWAGALY